MTKDERREMLEEQIKFKGKVTFSEIKENGGIQIGDDTIKTGVVSVQDA